MIYFPYILSPFLITTVWILVRLSFRLKTRQFHWRRELQLLLVYVCIVVVVRFTFFPFSKVNGQVQPLELDLAHLFPPRINLLPFVYLFDYPTMREALINVIGNTLMFLPLGIVWPSVFKELDTHGKVIAAGIGTSVLIEILQLPFYSRCSDIDDLILNSLGYLMGYGIYLLVKKCRKKKHP